MLGRPDRQAPHAGLRFSASGLDIEDHVGIAGAREGGSPTGRALLLRPAAAGPRALPRLHPVSTRLDEDGGLELAVGIDAEGDFWFDAPGAGRFFLRGDGALVEANYAAGPHAAVLRTRILLGHVLPIAALLRGLEVLHASAVVLPAAAVAIHGSSGAGKTSVALELARNGARMLTDDGLAVESTDRGVLAFPGIGTANVRLQDADRMGESGLSAAGSVIGEDRWSVRLQLAAPERAPARLGALYLLRRRKGAGRVEIVHVAAPDPHRILDAAMNVGLRIVGRLAAQLELSSRAAQTVRVCEVLIPDGAGPGETAAAIEADTDAAL